MSRALSSFWISLSSILFSELGDKTFFISAVLSMSNPAVLVFSGSIIALISMTLLACVVGVIIPSMFTPKYTHYISSFLLVVIGIINIYDGIFTSGDTTNKGFQQVEMELRNEDELGNVKDTDTNNDIELYKNKVFCEDRSNYRFLDILSKSKLFKYKINRIFLKAFWLTTIAEWGDRSQITTITLSASNDPFIISLGSILGHIICTGLACYSGKYLSNIPPMIISISGGILFIYFGLHGIYSGL
ncbi:hypothetical protein cand_010450 [Cryptosporidium andersoni]|uniref:GDT1 family protein n=1 Tax=Cryptosporidium andersoni TaxID=117008 RepID=A0A1J4MQE5_9CRYT|nr:hypothetical protein cand_010450 [Cryptosporidium andersoni]